MKLDKILSILLIIGFASNTLSQNFSYFPLAVGNKWFFSRGDDNVIRLKLEIQKDTTLSDGYSYAKFNLYQVNPDSSFSLLNEGYSFLRKEGRKIIEFPDRLIFDYDMSIGDTVVCFGNEPYPAVLDTIIMENVFGRNLNTYVFFFTEFDYYTYTDSIGFNTFWATTWHNWFPEYLLGCEIDGEAYGDIITAVESEKEIITNFILYQNYPNPFNSSTTITFTIPKSEKVIIKVFDVLGKEVSELLNEKKSAGTYDIKFNGSNLSTGVYFYKMQAGNFIDTKKFLLLK